ncbi:mucin-2-like [Oppia nitens]|uniref:mucin-2-like n=1 Tax=Oppia nitens TaxID=1686743 RepID=UPI0023D9A97B|nr:mucin-2-like [Oppia nitens]
MKIWLPSPIDAAQVSTNGSNNHNQQQQQLNNSNNNSKPWDDILDPQSNHLTDVLQHWKPDPIFNEHNINHHDHDDHDNYGESYNYNHHNHQNGNQYSSHNQNQHNHHHQQQQHHQQQDNYDSAVPEYHPMFPPIPEYPPPRYTTTTTTTTNTTTSTTNRPTIRTRSPLMTTQILNTIFTGLFTTDIPDSTSSADVTIATTAPTTDNGDTDTSPPGPTKAPLLSTTLSIQTKSVTDILLTTAVTSGTSVDSSQTTIAINEMSTTEAPNAPTTVGLPPQTQSPPQTTVMGDQSTTIIGGQQTTGPPVTDMTIQPTTNSDNANNTQGAPISTSLFTGPTRRTTTTTTTSQRPTRTPSRRPTSTTSRRPTTTTTRPRPEPPHHEPHPEDWLYPNFGGQQQWPGFGQPESHGGGGSGGLIPTDHLGPKPESEQWPWINPRKSIMQ